MKYYYFVLSHRVPGAVCCTVVVYAVGTHNQLYCLLFHTCLYDTTTCNCSWTGGTLYYECTTKLTSEKDI